MKIEDYDVLKVTKETEAHFRESGVTAFVESYTTHPETYPPGSIFLSLRRRTKSVVEFRDRSFTKVFEEIVLSPDGRVGTLEGGLKKKKIA